MWLGCSIPACVTLIPNVLGSSCTETTSWRSGYAVNRCNSELSLHWVVGKTRFMETPDGASWMVLLRTVRFCTGTLRVVWRFEKQAPLCVTWTCGRTVTMQIGPRREAWGRSETKNQVRCNGWSRQSSRDSLCQALSHSYSLDTTSCSGGSGQVEVDRDADVEDLGTTHVDGKRMLRLLWDMGIVKITGRSEPSLRVSVERMA